MSEGQFIKLEPGCYEIATGSRKKTWHWITVHGFGWAGAACTRTLSPAKETHVVGRVEAQRRVNCQVCTLMLAHPSEVPA